MLLKNGFFLIFGSIPKRVGPIKVGLHTKALKKMDLSESWQQHIFDIRGRDQGDTASCCMLL